MWRTIRDGALVVFLTLIFATVLKSCFIDAYKIPTDSMRETIAAGDYLLVNKFIYGARTPQRFLYISLPHFQFPKLKDIRRGDVVVFDFPGEANEVFPVRNLFFVKRCIGLPGDTIDIVNGNVRVNAMTLSFFDHVKEDLAPLIIPVKGMNVKIDPSTFSQWKVFIQREGSSVVQRDGKIYIDGNIAMFYTVKKDYFFVLGDNINNSSDSREWGFVPEENIVGKAMLIYWSKGDDGIRWNRIGTIVQ